MKVELWYDPVYTETGVRLNGYWQEGQDIYSFLYSVRRYPLQAWLEPDGSWPGLRQQILDISRGEEVELIFHGREIDFTDIARALQQTELIQLSHCPWDSEGAYAGQRGQLETAIQMAAAGAPADLPLERALSLEEPGADQMGWYLTAWTEEDLQRAERAEEPCVLVQEPLLDSYDQLPRIEKLTRSLHRPAQAVCCCIRDEERRRDFARYASQFPRYGFTFAGTGGPPDFLLEKYGRPYLARRAHERCRKIGERVDALLGGVSEQDLSTRVQELIYRQQQGTMTWEDQQELAAIQERKNWLARNQGTGAKCRALAEFRAIRQLEQEGAHE